MTSALWARADAISSSVSCVRPPIRFARRLVVGDVRGAPRLPADPDRLLDQPLHRLQLVVARRPVLESEHADPKASVPDQRRKVGEDPGRPDRI